MLKIMKLK